MEKQLIRRESDLVDYLKVFIKRQRLIFAFTSALVLLTAVFSFLATPKYRATATLLIEEEGSKMLSLEDSFGNTSRVYQDLRFFNTQLKLLKSKSLIERVAKKMKLQSLSGYRPGPRPAGSEAAPSPSAVPNYSPIVRTILSKIDVRPLRETKLVELSFVAKSPELAADLVNALAVEFIDYTISKRYETTQQASDFLGEQIASLRDELAAKEQELQRYGQEKDMFFLSDAQSTTGNQFADLNQAYNQAILDRVNAESAYREIKDLDVDSIPQFVNNPVVQSLRTDYMRAKNDYDEKIKKFKPDYPEMIQLAARLDSMRNDLRRAVDTASTVYQSALNREKSLKALLENQKVDLAELNQNAIIYNNLKTEVETKRKLYDSLVERQNITLISSRLGGLDTSNISIVDRADVPSFPVSPRKALNLVLALVLGLFGGAGLALLSEYLDNTIKGGEDMEQLVGLPALGVIPHYEVARPDGRTRGRHVSLANDAVPAGRDSFELASYFQPNTQLAEYFRSVRTAIMFSLADRPIKTIAVTSALAQEGKTSIVANLAVSFSQLSQKVLLIEADMRRPKLHQIVNVRRIDGLSSYLAGQTPLAKAIQETFIENIWAISCGPLPPNPAELLNSGKMNELLNAAKQEYDIILIDTPPLLAVTDALIVAAHADGVVHIVHSDKTGRKPFVRAVEELKKYQPRIFGVILNEVRMTKGDAYYREYYHPTQAGSSDQEEQENA